MRTSRSLARSSDAVGLKSGSCPSARIFAPRFLQTPPHDDALALRYPSPPSGWDGTSTRQLPNLHGYNEKARDPGPVLFDSNWGKPQVEVLRGPGWRSWGRHQ